jgi:superoxide dismutase
MSTKMIEFHHSKHQADVTNLNNLVRNGPLVPKSLEAIIEETAKDDTMIGVFNNAGLESYLLLELCEAAGRQCAHRQLRVVHFGDKSNLLHR